MSILGNNINNDSFANSYSANSNNDGVLLRPPMNPSFNDARNAADYRPIGAHAVSWGAVIAGTVAAAAISLLFIVLGAGLGMSSASVFSGQGLDATTLGITTIIWLALTQIIAYSIGGYLAGRLRTKTVSAHTDEVHFRDTAHGFLTWALSSLLCVTFLASAIGSIVGGAAKMSGSVIGGAATASMVGAASADMDEVGDEFKNMISGNNLTKYLVGSLFRKEASANSAVNKDEGRDSSNSRNTNIRQTEPLDESAEVASIFMNNMNATTLPASDVQYLAKLVSEQTGLSQAQAEDRVNSTFTQLQQKKTAAIVKAKDATEQARKTGAYTALSFFGFLLIGAISACVAATIGGKTRDI